jgi:hypothetical protein
MTVHQIDQFGCVKLPQADCPVMKQTIQNVSMVALSPYKPGHDSQ